MSTLSPEQLSAEVLSLRLTAAIQDMPLHDRPSDLWRMTPELAYGRHRGPARMRSRQAAVAVCLLPRPDQWVVVLTRRPVALKHHGGQICFPGGRIEDGETPEQAALREFEEELGEAADVHHACGRLPNQYVYASDNEVTPVVFVLGDVNPPPKDWSPDPGEVDEVIEVPAAKFILDREREICRTRQHRTMRFTDSPQSAVTGATPGNLPAESSVDFFAPAFQYNDYSIWGATAVILDQLAHCLRVHDQISDGSQDRCQAGMAAG